MKIIISERADFQLKSTALYIQAEFGSKIRARFMQEYRHTLALLREHPHLGPVEPLLARLPGTYRSILIGRLNKLVYTISGNVIEIVDFWDTRRDPTGMANDVTS